jgi:secreted PhoX family phosphatase
MTSRFGWVVEIDPIDPTSIPKRRTTLAITRKGGGKIAS